MLWLVFGLETVTSALGVMASFGRVRFKFRVKDRVRFRIIYFQEGYGITFRVSVMLKFSGLQ